MASRQIVAALIVIGVAGAPGIAGTHRDEAHHFEFAFPAGWTPWPKETLAAANNFARQRSMGHKIEYAAGFQPGGILLGSYPYMLLQVQAHGNTNSSYEDIERGLSKGMQAVVKDVKSALADITKDISVGSAVLDRANNRVIVRYQLDAPNVGKVDGITLANIGKESIVSLHYYDRAKNFDESVKTFMLIGNSFDYEKDYRFQSAKPFLMLAGLDQGTLVMGLIAAFVAAIAGILWHASNTKSTDANWSSNPEAPWSPQE